MRLHEPPEMRLFHMKFKQWMDNKITYEELMDYHYCNNEDPLLEKIIRCIRIYFRNRKKRRALK